MSVSVDYFDPGIIEERDVSGEKRTSAEQDSARHHIIVSEKSFLFFLTKLNQKIFPRILQLVLETKDREIKIL